MHKPTIITCSKDYILFFLVLPCHHSIRREIVLHRHMDKPLLDQFSDHRIVFNEFFYSPEICWISILNRSNLKKPYFKQLSPKFFPVSQIVIVSIDISLYYISKTRKTNFGYGKCLIEILDTS